MSASLEWTEWHLTRSGWVQGTTKSETEMKVVANPPGAVATYRYVAEHSGYGKCDERVVQTSVATVAADELERLIGLYGSCPCCL